MAKVSVGEVFIAEVCLESPHVGCYEHGTTSDSHTHLTHYPFR